MLQEFKNHIEINFPELLQNPFLLACSGGVDSVVLSYLCAQNNMNFSIAHCNFKLRGKDSDTDEKFVRQLTIDLDVNYFSTSFNTESYMSKNKVSLQVAARELRYKWFARILKENGLKTVVTAHQADDNLETFIINLSRGTGVNGLTGIPIRTKLATRPLLTFTRAQILTYASDEGIKWREDATNKETKYLRNKIRHEIVPTLKKLHPTFLQNFKNTQEYLQETALLASDYINLLKKELFIKNENAVEVSIALLQQYKPNKTYIYALFREYGFTEWEDVVGLLTAVSGKEVYSKTHRLVKGRDVLVLQELKEPQHKLYYIDEHTHFIKEPISLKIEEVAAVSKIDLDTIYVNKRELEYPLVLRKWKEGDFFYPFGLKGKKKLSKFFKDQKMNLISKEEQWLLCSGDRIVWVVGKRADDRFKIDGDFGKILKIYLLK